MIITTEMAIRAIQLIRPAVEEKILNTEGTTWGPKWVEGRMKLPGVEETIKFVFGITRAIVWNPEWGKEVSFGRIAEAKLRVVMREGVNTSVVVATRPWQLMEGEYLYAGGAVRDGICVAVSGAKSATDEAIAEMVISAIVMLALLKTEKMLKSGLAQI